MASDVFENYVKGLVAIAPASQQRFLEAAYRKEPRDSRILLALWSVYAGQGLHAKALAAARNVYLDRPHGRGGFYPRLAELTRPSLFVWSSDDRVIPAAFSRHVAEWLPAAEQIVIDACGHAPQIERPEQTNGLVQRFFARVDALEVPSALARSRRAAAA